MRKTKLRILFDLLRGSRNKEPRLLIITDKEILRRHNGKMGLLQFIKPHGAIKDLCLERGEILEIFSKIEFITNEIIINHINPQEVEKFEEVLNYMDFFIKVKLLNEWGVINNKLKEKIICVKDVRNGFAHVWSEEEVKYKNKGIEENFVNFKQDLLYIWESLIKLNQDNQPNVDNLIKKLGKSE